MKKRNKYKSLIGIEPVGHVKVSRILSADIIIGLGILICLAVLMFYVIGSIISFIPSANKIQADQRTIQSNIDQLREEQAAMKIEISQTEPTTATITAATTATEANPWMEFKVTAYCSCVRCCGKTNGITASGNLVRESYTVAADWSVLPNGTVVEIEGVGIRTVEDNGVHGQQIDLYMADHQTALNWGVKYLRVRVNAP